MSLDRDAMYAAFEAAPGDLAGYGAMADELDDLGYPALAHAFRWMQRRGVWPHKRSHYAAGVVDRSLIAGRKVPKSSQWAWYRRPLYESDTTVPGVFPRADRKTHSLPQLLLYGKQKVCATHQECVMFLAVQLKTVGETYSLDLPAPKGIPLYEVLDDGKMREPPLFSEEV